jgi:hypothetical protein
MRRCEKGTCRTCTSREPEVKSYSIACIPAALGLFQSRKRCRSPHLGSGKVSAHGLSSVRSTPETLPLRCPARTAAHHHGNIQVRASTRLVPGFLQCATTPRRLLQSVTLRSVCGQINNTVVRLATSPGNRQKRHLVNDVPHLTCIHEPPLPNHVRRWLP